MHAQEGVITRLCYGAGSTENWGDLADASHQGRKTEVAFEAYFTGSTDGARLSKMATKLQPYIHLYIHENDRTLVSADKGCNWNIKSLSAFQEAPHPAVPPQDSWFWERYPACHLAAGP